MAVTQQALTLQAQLDASLAAVTDNHTRDLTAAWIRAWDEISPLLSAAIEQMATESQIGVISKLTLTRNAQLLAALDLVSRHLTELGHTAGLRILQDLTRVVTDAADAQHAIVGAQLPRGFDLPGSVPASTLEHIIARSATQITARTYPLAADAYDVMRRELVNGIAIGANPRATADRIVSRAETGFNGGLTRALNISRTETLDAHRAGAAAGQAAHSETLTGWIWLAHLSPRTCRSCIAMNGTFHTLDEPGPLDHQQGRCARMPQTKTWAELGINIPEPPSRVPDSEKWFAGLRPEEQQHILGEEGYAAWRRGDYPMDQWAERRRNDGWRDSYAPSSAPKGAKVA